MTKAILQKKKLGTILLIHGRFMEWYIVICHIHQRVIIYASQSYNYCINVANMNNERKVVLETKCRQKRHQTSGFQNWREGSGNDRQIKKNEKKTRNYNKIQLE